MKPGTTQAPAMSRITADTTRLASEPTAADWGSARKLPPLTSSTPACAHVGE